MRLRSLCNAGVKSRKVGHVIKKCSNHGEAPLCTSLVSYANLKPERKLMIELESSELITWDFIWTCEGLAHLATLPVTLSSYCDDLTIRPIVQCFRGAVIHSVDTCNYLSQRCLLFSLLAIDAALSVLESSTLQWRACHIGVKQSPSSN